MDIRILDREEATGIDPAEWDRLARVAHTPSPLYERWHLLPALKHLDRQDLVFVITVQDSGRLLCLFPVCLKRKAHLFPYLMLWEFRDCLICDVLREPGMELAPVLDHLMAHFATPLILSPAHVDQAFGRGVGPRFCQLRRARKAVTRRATWEEYQQGFTRKHRKENARVLARLIEREGVRYVTAARDLTERWLPLYCELERQSWKALAGRVIAGDEGRLAYFREALEQGEREGKVEFQALIKNDVVLAMSFRFRTGDRAYEIKTAYHGDYRHLYPGVVLELLNIRDVLSGGYALVDSCSEVNRVVDRLWPDSLILYRTLVFADTWLGTAARLAYKNLRPLIKHHTPEGFFCGGWSVRPKGVDERQAR